MKPFLGLARSTCFWYTEMYSKRNKNYKGANPCGTQDIREGAPGSRSTEKALMRRQTMLEAPFAEPNTTLPCRYFLTLVAWLGLFD